MSDPHACNTSSPFVSISVDANTTLFIAQSQIPRGTWSSLSLLPHSQSENLICPTFKLCALSDQFLSSLSLAPWCKPTVVSHPLVGLPASILASYHLFQQGLILAKPKSDHVTFLHITHSVKAKILVVIAYTTLHEGPLLISDLVFYCFSLPTHKADVLYLRTFAWASAWNHLPLEPPMASSFNCWKPFKHHLLNYVHLSHPI